MSRDHQSHLGSTSVHVDIGDKFHANPSNSCQDISLKAEDVIVLVALDRKSGDQLATNYKVKSKSIG